MFVQLCPQSAPESNASVWLYLHGIVLQTRPLLVHCQQANHTLSSGLNNRQPLDVIQFSVQHASINTHTAINAISHSVCGPHSIPPSVREGNHERMPTNSNLYPLQLSNTSPVSDWTLEEWSVWEWEKTGINESVLLCQATDICMDIHSKLPENRLWLWNTWSEARFRHCATNVRPFCVFFFLFAKFVSHCFFFERV